MKRVLVIGGSGFIGSHLIRELLDTGHEVYALQHRSPVQSAGETRIIKGGIRTIDHRTVDIIRPEIIYHCARPTLPRFRSVGRMAAARMAAKLNTRLLRELGKSEQKPLLVFASGSLMYGNSPLPHDEHSPLNPVSYARQYYRGEVPLIHAIEDKSYPVMMLRFPWLLGAGSWFKWFYLDMIGKHSAIPAFGDTENRMEIIGVEEAAKLMRKYSVEMRSTGIFNIPAGKAVTQREFLEQATSVFKVRIEDHSKLFQGKIEKEAYEAFTSNITLKTLFPEVIEEYPYKSLEELIRSASEG